MPGPWKPWNDADVGEYAQLNHEFLKYMYQEGPGNPPGGYRDRYLNFTSDELRRALAQDLKILIPANVKAYVFDCESLRWNDPDGIDWHNDTWYMMVLPPTPRGHYPPNPPSGDYTECQAWEGAWYHAMVDSLGM